MFNLQKKTTLPASDSALPGRDQAVFEGGAHAVNGNPMLGNCPQGHEEVFLGMGCFWGAERRFWQTDGVWVTAAGYAGGFTPNPTYEEVCSGQTGHTEVVRVVYDPRVVTFQQLLAVFWEAHDPTQGMRQGNDTGTQYRSAIYCTRESQYEEAQASKAAYEQKLSGAGFGPVTTEVRKEVAFYPAEAYHQQYLEKNPGGYCGLRGTGVACS